MRRVAKPVTLALLALASAGAALAEDRITVTANGSTLTDTNGGAGGSLGWLHDLNANAVLGVAGEYQRLGDSRWKFGSLTGAWTGGGEGKKWSVYGGAHIGTGDEPVRTFDYRLGEVGAILPLYRKLSLQVEDKQIDIDTTRGNLPKVGLSLSWTSRLQTSLAYARSVSGNLGTDLTTGRLDYYGSAAHFILGGAAGPASTVVLNLPPGFNFPSRNLREGFIGFSHAFKRTEILVLGDYLKIGDSKRLTLTLSYTLHLNVPAKLK